MNKDQSHCPDPTLTVDHINHVIRQRRTIKPTDLSDRPIPENILVDLLECANWAPTHGLTQPWRFFVFRGPARIRLADFLAETYRRITPAESFKEKKFDNLKRNPTLAPVVIAIGMKRQEIEKISEQDELLAVACAVQNLHLAATAHGLGGFWSTNAATVSDAMRDFLKLGPNDRALGLFYLGYPAQPWPKSQRKPIDEQVQWFDQ